MQGNVRQELNILLESVFEDLFVVLVLVGTKKCVDDSCCNFD